MSFALLPLTSPFPLLFSSFCLPVLRSSTAEGGLPSAFSPQSPLSIGSFGQGAVQATRKRTAWELVGNRSGILGEGRRKKEEWRDEATQCDIEANPEAKQKAEMRPKPPQIGRAAASGAGPPPLACPSSPANYNAPANLSRASTTSRYPLPGPFYSLNP